MKKVILLLISSLAAVCAVAQVSLPGKDFDLGRAVIFTDSSDPQAVGTAADLLASDIEAVCGKRPLRTAVLPRRAQAVVIAGTLEGCAPIRDLAAKGKIDVSGIAGSWERYAVRLVRNPFPGISRALVIAGSDRRGAAYGLLSVSEAIGVSPWYWWADVPVPQRKDLRAAVAPFDSPAPSVKYRGIFINDEDWGLLPWATKTYEPEEGSIGPKTYARVCELLLRLGANYLCPAMHRRSKAFNENPENKKVADRYGIVMGSVHCEPLLYNNAREWDKTVMGPWNYETNKDRINGVLRKRVSENAAYENVYTLALRGLHDKAMEGSASLEARKRILESALEDQRAILKEFIDTPLEEIPQAFTPYKEVLEIYERGLRLPDEVTIIWPDDNYGYLKRLSDPAERLRGGRAGVYYHVSYHGGPHDYLWLDTTPPSLMYEELSKAYASGADRIWLLNAGDLKFCEYGTDLFLRMARDIDAFDFASIATDKARWLAAMFGQEHLEALQAICEEYYLLAFPAKPEFMGWGMEWNRKYNKQASVTDTDFSFSSYREAQTRMDRYEKLRQRSAALLEALPEERKAAFFELVDYPVEGAALMNRMHLAAQGSRLYRRQGLAPAATLGALAKDSYRQLVTITDRYNALLGGKWAGIASLAHGVTANYFREPDADDSPVTGPASLAIRSEGDCTPVGTSAFHSLPCFNKYFPERSYSFEICNAGSGTFSWTAEADEPWIRLSRSAGTCRDSEPVSVSIDWDKLPAGCSELAGRIAVQGAGSSAGILVSVFNPSSPSREETSGLFVEDNGVVSIPAASFHRKTEKNGISFIIAPGLGAEGAGVQMGSALQPHQDLKDMAPCLEYDFWCFNAGSVDVWTWALPTFPLHGRDSATTDYAGTGPADGEQRYGVSIDGAEVKTPSISSSEYAQAWMDNVLHNSCVKKVTLNVREPGRHTLRIWCGDPGVVIQKAVLDFGGMRKSLLGPPPTRAR